ncbi:tRNA (adenosine(37)-N6)-dimethylallyltransferase MiaA [Kineobactrum sediminis]|uniref:tRNA dimethylallyltransferase n=1 Tax=Kineobactrum sediminis TaxID=1905677 RepID=A0A2N5Y0A3_9GAMM|nr:tRNA (adenosine(37)-N6)-dimethylallyltransferase MiaA [Kineobactrum sediminis]PLW81822.1 tRNA (adenosine(37)-N6)-dimethylallyltransferase MiaA [Kineobactrum sediminis]
MAPEQVARPLVVCLLGPTAAGKTDLAIELAQALGGELVSVDSALVYRGLDIGSAKPDYPHHLVDIRDPADSYSAADFVADARGVIADIVARGKTPILVGGTMLYFRAFLEGLASMPGTDPVIRADIEAEAARIGWPALHARLVDVDPKTAAQIHPNHSQRISRALEVFVGSGIPLSHWQHSGAGALPAAAGYRIRQLAICPRDRAVLHQRIARRFLAMVDAGLVEEVRRLHERPELHAGLPAIRAVGYRQVWRFLEGECSLDEAIEQGIAATRQLAKRQLTWLRKWPDLHWLQTDERGNICAPAGSDDVACGMGEKPLRHALNYIRRAPI